MSLQCRVCLDYAKHCTSLFVCTDGTTLAQIIQFCADIQIAEDDDLPCHICLKCSEDAKLAYMFVKKCRQSNNELHAQHILSKLLVQRINTTTEDRSDLSSPAGSERQRTCELLVEFVVEPTEVEKEVLQIETLDEHLDEEGGHIASHGSTTDNDDYIEAEYLEESSDLDQTNEDIRDSPIVFDCSEGDTFTRAHYCCHSDCVLMFYTKHDLKEHIHSQHVLDVAQETPSNERYSCGNCDQSFFTASELDTHEALLALKRSIVNPTTKGRPKTYPCLFTAAEKKCCDCYAPFSTVEALLEHSAQHHSVRQTVQDPARPIRCPVCFKLFRCKATLIFHQNAPYKPRNYRCRTCGVAYRTPSQLATHEAVHTAGQKYVCAECDTCFKSEHNLKSHALLHREKREVCGTCGMCFHRKSNLRMHERIHSEAYYCVCPHCDRKCKNRSQLREHQKVHTQKKTLDCRYCSRSFAYISDRKRHEMTHTGDYPFVCSCSKMFSRSRLYEKHVSKCKVAMDSQEKEMHSGPSKLSGRNEFKLVGVPPSATASSGAHRLAAVPLPLLPLPLPMAHPEPHVSAPVPGGGPRVADGFAIGVHQTSAAVELVAIVALAPVAAELSADQTDLPAGPSGFPPAIDVSEAAVLKLQAEDVRFSPPPSAAVGDAFSVTTTGLTPPNSSESLAVEMDSGERATLPGVILGSSSIFSCVPCADESMLNRADNDIAGSCRNDGVLRLLLLLLLLLQGYDGRREDATAGGRDDWILAQCHLSKGALECHEILLLLLLLLLLLAHKLYLLHQHTKLLIGGLCRGDRSQLLLLLLLLLMCRLWLLIRTTASRREQ
uniref:Protein krueppel n=1 Tax=Anopheles dirus TaxID=7168 RepID=A0A182MZD2_9DIPT